jgi:transglutaminase-like putative cysteine protease
MGDVEEAVAETGEKIGSAHATLERRALAAIRFVQDESRYLGIEVEEGTLRPDAPDAVLRRRFGDCKDKTFFCWSFCGNWRSRHG